MKLPSPLMTAALASSIASPFVKAQQQCKTGIEIPPSDLQALLPESLPWNDSKSEIYIAGTENSFVTPAESSNFTETATYEEITDFFTRLAAASDYVEVESLETLANGEKLWMVTVSGEQQFNPDGMTRPIVFATGAIHAGESSGTNAGMMFVRNLGYLRQNINGRINQHGPNTSGRRANAHFYNLNRDFAKLDTPEIRAVVGVMDNYNLSFYTDLHSTDGLSYQPDVTWCDNGDAGLSNNIYSWLRSEMAPDLKEYLESMGHFPGPCYFANDAFDPTAGSYPYYSDGPDYSGNYADHRQIPAYLLEIQSLKPNKQRVLGAYNFLHGILQIIVEKADSLQEAIDADVAARVDPVPIAWDYDDPAPTMEWPLFNWTISQNPTLNISQIIWSDSPITITVEESVRSTALNPPDRPLSIIVPAVWSDVVERLNLHGIDMQVFTEEVELEVKHYRVEDFEASRLREGHAFVNGGTPVPETCMRTYKKNDILITTDQPLGTLAVALLHPTGEGSLYNWGFFNAAFQSHEYPENYIMVPLAEKMLAESPEIAAEWETYKAENPMYYRDGDAVINWFFRRSALYDSESFLYPVGFVMTDPRRELPLAPYPNTKAEQPSMTVNDSGGSVTDTNGDASSEFSDESSAVEDNGDVPVYPPEETEPDPSSAASTGLSIFMASFLVSSVFYFG